MFAKLQDDNKSKKKFYISMLVILFSIYFLSAPLEMVSAYIQLANNQSIVFTWEQFLNLTMLDQARPQDVFLEIYVYMCLMMFLAGVFGYYLNELFKNMPHLRRRKLYKAMSP